ncbi:MAG: 5-aminopentanamidase [Desulfuromonadales bacterium]|nr:5-aminopentanamidase [Desulfuromonadales bacterium]
MGPDDRNMLRIAFLHLAPAPCDVPGNRSLVVRGIQAAASRGAQWVITPELCVCGYTFADRIGTDWIKPQPDPWMAELCRLTADLGMTVFLGHPEREEQTGNLFNSVFVISDGKIIGRHRKINTLRKGSEAWSHPAERACPISVAPIGMVGIMICGDAFSPGIARHLKKQGARLLVSSAAWAPGFHGPDGEWERCSLDTGLPLIVCNRSGVDLTLDFTAAESVVAKDGRRLLTFSAPTSTAVIVDWDLAGETLAKTSCRKVAIR